MKNQNKLIAVILFLTLTAGIAFAMFTDQLMINGTARADGAFELEWTHATADDNAGVTISGVSGSMVAPGLGAQTFDVSVDLAFPGDSRTITGFIRNNGTLDAEVLTVNILDGNGNLFSDVLIEVTQVAGVNVGDIVSPAPVDTHEFQFTVAWDPTQTSVTLPHTANFTVEIDFQQYTP